MRGFCCILDAQFPNSKSLRREKFLPTNLPTANGSYSPFQRLGSSRRERKSLIIRVCLDCRVSGLLLSPRYCDGSLYVLQLRGCPKQRIRVLCDNDLPRTFPFFNHKRHQPEPGRTVCSVVILVVCHLPTPMNNRQVRS